MPKSPRPDNADQCLRLLRQRCGISQDSLARSLGVSRETIKSYESRRLGNGNISDRIAKAIEQKFRVIWSPDSKQWRSTEMKNFVFDIETGPLGSDALDLIMPPFNEADVKLGLLKDPVKIAEKIEKARTDHVTRFMRNAALSPLTGQILAIGIAGPINERQVMIDSNERILIGAFFDVFASSFDREPTHWIGFNIANFDVPFLVRRAWHHGVAIPEQLLSRRYLNTCFTDIYLHWQLTHYPPEHVSLNALAQFFGLPAKDGDGAEFAELLRYNPKAAIEYLTTDLTITWEIAKRLNLFRRDQPRQEVKPAPAPTISEPEPEPDIRFY